MDKELRFHLLMAACLTGFLGDAGLQFLVKGVKGVKGGLPPLGGTTGWGLKEYFAQHGSAESLFIAGGMLSLFYLVYLVVLPPNPVYLAVYGVLLDLVFREFALFPSLTGYYRHLNYFWSAFWGAVPMVIPYYLIVNT